MKQIYHWAIAFIVLAIPFIAKSQVTVASNAGFNTNFVGWNAAQAFPLQIKHEGNQPINFFTNNVLRMSLRTDGNLNMVNPATGFWIDGNRVLWHNLAGVKNCGDFYLWGNNQFG